MKKILIIPNMKRDIDGLGTKKIINIIKNNNYVPVLDSELKKYNFDCEYTGSINPNDYYMAVFIGGDGTILSSARQFINTDTPILGVNYGHVGFLTEIEKGESIKFTEIINGNYIIEKRPVLSIEFCGSKQYAINEVAIHRGNSAKMLNIDIKIDDNSLSNFRADGIIISTSSGSTAYSLSAGGPIIDPTVDAFVITPVCPHNLYFRSVVVPSKREIVVNLSDTVSGTFSIDGNLIAQLDGNHAIKITEGGYLNMVKTDENSFYDKIKRKIFEKEV